ncbi:MAG: ATP-binding cassette domain-containing protein [Sediminibacterium sp.]|nr:ATP-binding cassette domain-containing protein [Sediminibacterium sp.]
MIEIRSISKKFDGRVILNDIQFVFETGQCNLIIGISGSGKSVLIKCMLGLLKPEKGYIAYDGLPFLSSTESKRNLVLHNIGVLFQGNALFDSMTIEENVAFPLDMFTTLTRLEKNKKVDAVLERVNLKGINKLKPNEISGGMKKRVGIARAIIRMPKFLFCDEPNSGLDPQTSLLIDKLIKEITLDFNMTTVVVTHDMNSVMEIGNKILFLYKGVKHWEGSNTDIIKAHNQELNDFIFASDFLKELKLLAK